MDVTTDEQVSVAEAARRCGVSSQLIHWWRQKGSLASEQDVTRAGKPCSVLLGDVEQLAAAHRAKAIRPRLPLSAKYCRAGLEPDPACGPDPILAVVAAINRGELLTAHDRVVLDARRERFERLRAA